MLSGVISAYLCQVPHDDVGHARLLHVHQQHSVELGARCHRPTAVLPDLEAVARLRAGRQAAVQRQTVAVGIQQLRMQKQGGQCFVMSIQLSEALDRVATERQAAVQRQAVAIGVQPLRTGPPARLTD